MAEMKTGKAAATTAPRNAETDHDRDERQHMTAGETSVNQVNLEETRRVPDERLERLNSKNEEGHKKNMEAIEKAHDGKEDGKPDSKLGREDNGNTPRINADGSKTWNPPGVAGAPR